jgi:hypothetical protein
MPEAWLRGPVAGVDAFLQPAAHALVQGRAALPSTLLGLHFHTAEHTTRHVGQAITTAKIVTADLA